MHKNVHYIGLLLLLSAFVLWWTYDAIYLTFRYYALSASTTVVITEVNTIKKDEDDYRLEIEYLYIAGENSYKKTQIMPSSYLNLFAVQKAIDELKNKNLPLYFNPRDPNQASLERVFPLKQCLYAIIMISILCYFIGLGYCIKKNRVG